MGVHEHQSAMVHMPIIGGDFVGLNCDCTDALVGCRIEEAPTCIPAGNIYIASSYSLREIGRAHV